MIFSKADFCFPALTCPTNSTAPASSASRLSVAPSASPTLKPAPAATTTLSTTMIIVAGTGTGTGTAVEIVTMTVIGGGITANGIGIGSLLLHNYTILSEADTRQRQEEDISRVSTVLSISRSVACVLLRHYNWSVTKVHDEWFADEEKVRKAVGLLEQPADMPNDNEVHITAKLRGLVYGGIGGGIRGNDDKNDSSLNNVDFGGSLTYSG
uniref:E3 ubiquitin-protein ligase ARIH1-like UBA-like domain-containing protein n=1 Tax=Ananas comosus var. bracteatus TaxID=296719 RepID=A0A6V7PEC5_ANACO|nr:unnamed protein product [Ananas comosus var. bracteatus]